MAGTIIGVIVAVVVTLLIAVPVTCKVAVDKKVRKDAEIIGTAEDKARNILDEVKAAVSKFSIIAQENGIPQDWIDRISEVLKTLVKE